MLDHRDMSVALAEAAQEVSGPRDYARTLQTIVEVARDSMPGIDHVGISVAHRDGGIETQAATDDFVRRLDELQHELGEGPCLHAVDAEPLVRVEHVAQDPRWPLFLPRAAELGLRAHLGVQLYLDHSTHGALNLYSVSLDEIDRETEELAELFGTHSAVALAHARQVEHLNLALASRTTISLGLGMLMERLGIDQEAAFAYLTRVSAATETKIREVAASIVEQHQPRRGA